MHAAPGMGAVACGPHPSMAAQVNQRIFIFGGALAKGGGATNELLWMTSERMEWHCQPTRGDKPCPR